MKKFVVLVSLLFASSSYACSFKTNDSENIREVVRQNGGYPISDARCNFLNQQNLALSVDGAATVLDGVSVGWAVVTLSSPQTGIKADRVRLATRVNSRVASQDAADNLLFQAIRDAVTGLEYERAAGEISAYLAKTRKMPALK